MQLGETHKTTLQTSGGQFLSGGKAMHIKVNWRKSVTQVLGQLARDLASLDQAWSSLG